MTAGTPQQRCPHCGANLSLDDLRGTNCRYCGTALPHHARAAEHAALVNQVLQQQFQARGLAPPATPIVPYQAGAPPNLPGYPQSLPGAPPNLYGVPPGAMPHRVAHGIHQSARRWIGIALVVGGAILLLSLAGAVAAFYLLAG